MNTGNLLLHQWIMTTHPKIVSSLEQYNDPKQFQPLLLDTAVPTASGDDLVGKLTSVVTYHTRYKNASNNEVILKFGIGPSIQVNAIIGLPTIIKWGLVPDVVNGVCYSYTLQRKFKLHFDSASKGLPPGINFSSADFQRPNTSTSDTSTNLCINTDECTLSIPNSSSH